MSHPVTVAIGSRNRSSASADMRSRMLTLFGPNAPRRADGVFALIEASTPGVDHAYDALKAALKARDAPDSPSPGMDEYVVEVLTALNLDGASVALAVWSGQDVVLASYQGGQAFACTSDGLLDVAAAESETAQGAGVHLRHFTPSVNDAVVLTSESVTARIQAKHGEQTICGAVRAVSDSFSVQDAAEWLSFLAAGRSDRSAGALVVQFQGLQRAVTVPKKWGFIRPEWLVPPSRTVGLGIAGLALCAAAIVPAFSVSQRHASSNHASPRRPVNVRTQGPVPPTAAPTVAPTAPPTASRPVRAQPKSAPSPTRVTRPRPSGATGLTHPLESWKFPALPNTPGTVLLALYNPQKDALLTDVRIIGRTGVDARRVRVPGSSTINLPVPSSEVRDSHQGLTAIIVQDNAPVVPMRVVVRQGTASSSA